MLLLTPVIVNDGRRLLIGTQGVGHLCRPPGRTRMGPYEVDGADLRTLFGAQGADSLRLLSALRMSASYPYVLPAVSLPSVPPIDILDAANFFAGGSFDTGRAAVWAAGDFTYDGVVDILDASSFFATGLFDAGNYNSGSAGSVSPK